MQPRLQKGAWSGTAACRTTGSVLGVVGIAAGHGERGVGAQVDRAADLARRAASIQSGWMAAIDAGCATSGSHRSRAPRGGAALAPRMPGDRRPARTGGAAARTDDLEEAEAIDRGPLERRRQDAIDRFGRPPAAPPCRRSSASRSRSIRRCHDGGSSARRPWRRPARAVRAARCHRRRSRSSPASARHAELAAGKGDDPAARFVEQVVPARSLERVGRETGTPEPRPAIAGAGAGSASLTRASGRFHGSAPASASRVTSIVRARPFGDAGAPLGSRYSLSPAARDGQRGRSRSAAPRGSSRRGRCPSRRIRASTISPFSTSAARISPMPALDQPLRQGR